MDANGDIVAIQAKVQNDSLVKLREVIEFFPRATVMVDEAGKPVFYNRAAAEILGEIPEFITLEQWPRQFGLFLDEAQTPYPLDRFPLTQALSGKHVEHEETVYLNNSSMQSRWISLSAKPVTSADGKIEAALLFLSDITQQKQSEIRAAKQARQALASFTLSQSISKIGNEPLQILSTVVKFSAETIGDGCIAALITPPNNQLKTIAFYHANPSHQAQLSQVTLAQNYELEGMIEWVVRTGEPLLVPVVDTINIKQNAPNSQPRAEGENEVYSFLVVPIKGRNRVLGTLMLFRDHPGSPFTTDDQAYMLDVACRTGLAIDNNTLVRSLRLESSGRKLAEKALEFSEVRFQSVFTSTALGIKLLDLDGNILETNPAFQRMLGYTEDELHGNPISTYWHPVEIKRLTKLLEDLKNERVQSFQLEHRLINKDGGIVWVNVTFTGITRNEQEGSSGFIVAISENITERKRIEAEMTEMKRRMHSHVEMERLQLAQELHDGPLQDLYSSIYKIENWADQPGRESREKIEMLKQELLGVVQELRSTAKNLRPPTLANFGLEKAIRSHAEEFREKYPEIALHLSLAQDKQSLPEDIRLILYRIYQHSLVNVIRHAQAHEVHVHFTFDVEEAQLEVRDNGVGFIVPSSWVELVKQGHFGLAGAVERVSLLGGVFNVESAPGSGTIARVAIPIRDNTESGNSSLGRSNP
jgi:PAS domain S-box-containing protein